MTVITRFAPSPTGFLHIGSARTALFNYLFACHHHGKFLLRIEDTDKARSTTEATTAILTSLKWLGLDWDGEIIYQAKRNELHHQAAMQLLNQGKAYYCFTPQADIEQLRNNAAANKQHFLFNSPWREADPKTYPKDIKPVIRLKANKEGQTIIHDRLQGNVVIENTHMDDMVLVRGDGTATYMLAVVVDDHDMEITHIIRGDDHLTNAARQIQLYQAFGWKIPEMVHIPLIHGPDGAKLSKRHGALGVEAYKEMGYLPEALCNYLLRLGWSHGDDEIIAKTTAINWFNLEGLGASPARLDFAKMRHLNAHYLRNKDNQELAAIVVAELAKHYKISDEERKYILQAMDAIKIRAELITDLVELAKIFLISSSIEYSDEAILILQQSNKNYVEQVIAMLKTIKNNDKETIQNSFKHLATDNQIKLGELMKPIRVLITGLANSPSIFEIIEIIGIEHSIERLKKIYIQ
ncbi:glutamate--tRNA ligase [Candidatus Trichorickettsia mobilis]|uniref:glutamate--tRNA ligase n=1 Tax=Candidatus Trichorickettsia mobilis TaxID=1346319 RepID=UPI002931D863|nr:glutamate--tRNA ligase [Candidatus Trichorickettsia mobilis]